MSYRRATHGRWAGGALLLALTVLGAPGAHAAEPTLVPGQVVVRFAPGTSAEDRATALAAHGARVVQRSTVAGYALAELEDGRLVRATAAALEAEDAISSAQPNFLYAAASACPEAMTNDRCLPIRPGDPAFRTQFSLHNTGQTVAARASLADADIDAPEAWNITQGSPDVTVAVVDSGIDYHQPDFRGRIWENEGELGTDAAGRDRRSNGVDDDGNGYADDWRGWDFVGRRIDDPSDTDNDPLDLRNHGTHVAGIIGSNADNGFGVRGVDWHARLMAVRVQGSMSQNTMFDIAQGFDYAADNGARVVNASLGGPERSDLLEAVIREHPDVLFVVAAYNRTLDLDLPGNEMYPCEFDLDNIICLAASDNRDRVAYFSNYSKTSTDLFAPGTPVNSTFPAYGDVFSETFEGDLSRWNLGGWSAFAGHQRYGAYSLTDSATGAYPAPGDAPVTLRAPIDLRGRQGCTLAWWLDMDLAAGDGFYVQERRDGAFLPVRPDYDVDRPASFGDTFAYMKGAFVGNRRLDVSDFDGGPLWLRFGLLARGDNAEGHDGAYVDHLRVFCLSSTYSSNGVKELSIEAGTSMATPHTAGVAALVMAKYPDASVAEVKAKILRGVDVKHAFVGRSVTGGRLNAYKALAESDVAVAEEGTLTFAAGDGQRNDVRVTQVTGADGVVRLQVEDVYSTSSSVAVVQTGSRLRPGSGCEGVAPNRVLCTGAQRVVVDAGDLDDRVSLTGVRLPGVLRGGDGKDLLTGGLGADAFEGGRGNDTIQARERVRDAGFDCGEDAVSPGTDRDTVIADVADPVTASSAGCEAVSKA